MEAKSAVEDGVKAGAKKGSGRGWDAAGLSAASRIRDFALSASSFMQQS